MLIYTFSKQFIIVDVKQGKKAGYYRSLFIIFPFVQLYVAQCKFDILIPITCRHYQSKAFLINTLYIVLTLFIAAGFLCLQISCKQVDIWIATEKSQQTKAIGMLTRLSLAVCFSSVLSLQLHCFNRSVLYTKRWGLLQTVNHFVEMCICLTVQYMFVYSACITFVILVVLFIWQVSISKSWWSIYKWSMVKCVAFLFTALLSFFIYVKYLLLFRENSDMGQKTLVDFNIVIFIMEKSTENHFFIWWLRFWKTDTDHCVNIQYLMLLVRQNISDSF